MQDKEKLNSLPQWKSHKVVRGAQIIEMLKHEDGVRLILDHPSKVGDREMPTTAVEVDTAWMLKFNPVVGNWFVVYEDGYTSISPDEAWVGGYSAVSADKVPLYEMADGTRVGLDERVTRDLEALKAFSKKVDAAIQAVMGSGECEFSAPQQIHNYRAKLIKEFMETQYACYKQVIVDGVSPVSVSNPTASGSN